MREEKLDWLQSKTFLVIYVLSLNELHTNCDK